MPSPFKNPDLMVIGDSLAQGCRSMSVTGAFCEDSYANIIAKRRGMEFNVPAFARPVIFDAEDTVRRYLNVGGLLQIGKLFKSIQGNYEAWVEHFDKPPESGQEWADNLAVAGASLVEMTEFHWDRTRDLIAQYRDIELLDAMRHKKVDVMDIHLAINSGFVLNPSGKKKYHDWTMLDWVAERRPKHLLVHMGHNDGLYPIGSNAIARDISQTTAPEYLKRIDEIEEATTKDQHLIFILLPKISCVANLRVSGDGPNSSGYWDLYIPDFSNSNRTFDAKAMEAMDDGIVQANILISQRLEKLKSKRKVTVIEAYKIFREKDYKNSRDPARQLRIGKYTIDNRYIEGKSPGELPGGPHGTSIPKPPAFYHGGFQSLDGMHPTAVGYAELAIEIMNALTWDYDKPAMREAGLKRESLITKYNGAINLVRTVMHLFRQNPEETGGPPTANGQTGGVADTAHTFECMRRCVHR